MTKSVARATGEFSFELGEGPVWNPRSQLLSMVDIFDKKVHLFALEAAGLQHVSAFDCGGDVGAALPLSDGSFLLCENQGVVLRDIEGNREKVCDLPVSGENFRFNDGKLGPDGKLWVGVMAYDASPGQGSLWRISRDGKAELLLEELTIPNGMDWWEEEFWFVNGPSQEIRCFTWGPSGLEPTNKSFSTQGTPDGLAIDGSGEIWLALWGEGRVDHYDKTGAVIESVDVASPQSTSLCFAGDGLSTLVITSANFMQSAETISKFPRAGDVFTAHVNSVGRLPNLNFL